MGGCRSSSGGGICNGGRRGGVMTVVVVRVVVNSHLFVESNVHQNSWGERWDLF